MDGPRHPPDSNVFESCACRLAHRRQAVKNEPWPCRRYSGQAVVVLRARGAATPLKISQNANKISNTSIGIQIIMPTSRMPRIRRGRPNVDAPDPGGDVEQKGNSGESPNFRYASCVILSGPCVG